MLVFFHKIIDVLDELEIPYMLSGSVAMSLYVVPRSTRDFDFIIHIEPKNIDAFAKKFENKYYCSKEAIIDAIKYKSIFNIIDHASSYKADFVVLKNEAFRLTEFKRKKKFDFMGKSINVVSPEDLIISKLIWIQTYQSAIQIDDIKNLLELENLDIPYIKNWVGILKIYTFKLLA